MSIIKSEKKYLFYHIIILALITLYISIYYKLFNILDKSLCYILIIWWIILLLKIIFLKLGINKSKFFRKGFFNLIRLGEVVLCAIAVVRLKHSYNLEITIVYLFVAIELYLLVRNLRLNWYRLYFIFAFISAEAIFLNTATYSLDNIWYVVLTVVVFIIIELEIRANIMNIRKKFKENKTLVDVIRKRYRKLRIKEEEIENMLRNYKNQVAELYILKEISNFVNDSLEKEDFIENAMDVLIGVIDLNICSIILYDEYEKIEEVYINTITCNIDKKYLREKIISDIEKNIEGIIVINENAVYNGEDFTSIIIPLSRNDTKYGALFLAYKGKNYFDNTIISLLGDVSKEIVLALENVILYEKIKDIAIRDNLTQLFNRTYLKKLWTILLNKIEPNKGNIVVALADIDNFKKINDYYGHVFGDEVLKELARIALEVFDKYEGCVVRYGGEEFLILIPNMNQDKATEVLNEFREIIEKSIVKGDKFEQKVTISIGFTIYPNIDKDISKVIVSADKALYISKQTGRNKVTIAEEKE